MLIPSSVAKENESMMIGFLWNCDLSKKGKAKVAWKSICKPKEYGVLGLRDLNLWNIAMLSGRVWRIINNHDSIWANWIRIHHLKGSSFWEVSPKDKCSWSWRMLLKI